MSDPRLHHAANWLSRFTVNGVAASDFHDVLDLADELGRLVPRLVGAGVRA